jgi:hypothetical protein
MNKDFLNCFNFDPYIKDGTPSQIPNPDRNFLEWFIGFFEAEGSFIQWFDKTPRFEIIMAQKDPKLMYKIKKSLGFGNVNKFTKNKQIYWCYRTGNLKHLVRLILLFNGNLVTLKKKVQFKDWLNNLNKVKNMQICFINGSNNISLRDGWLSGFLEGDGTFYADAQNMTYIAKNGQISFRVRMKFALTQKGELDLLNQVRSLLKISSLIYEFSNPLTSGNQLHLISYKYNRCETARLDSHQRLVKYLTKYPFRGDRNILFLNWSRLLQYRVNKYPVTEKSLKKLKRLIESTKNK